MTGKIIFSPDHKNQWLGDREFHSMLEFLKMNHVEFTLANGQYFNNYERSLLVNWTEKNYNLVIGLAKFFQQESILLVDSDSQAYLVFMDSMNEVRVGLWQSIDKEELQNYDSFTEIEGSFYVAK